MGVGVYVFAAGAPCRQSDRVRGAYRPYRSPYIHTGCLFDPRPWPPARLDCDAFSASRGSNQEKKRVSLLLPHRLKTHGIFVPSRPQPISRNTRAQLQE